MRDIPTSPRIIEIKRNRRVRRLRLIVLFSILFITIVGALSYFSNDSKIVINKIIITGNKIIDSKEIESNVYNNLNGKYLYLFAHSNFLIYPHDKIYDNLIIDFPRIESLKVTREGFNSIHISITERAGSYLYCGVLLPEVKDEIGENCYFVNNNGYIFDKAPYFSGDVYFKFYISIKGDASSPSGTQMLSPERFHSIIHFMDGISTLGFKPSYLVVSLNGLHSLYLKPKSVGLNPKIIFKEENDLNTILDNFSTAMSKYEFANEINSKYDTLSYIDLRFKNKVLYKFSTLGESTLGTQ